MHFPIWNWVTSCLSSLFSFALFLTLLDFNSQQQLNLLYCLHPPSHLCPSLSLSFAPIKRNGQKIHVDSDGFFLPVCAKVYISLFSIVGQVNLNLFWVLFLSLFFSCGPSIFFERNLKDKTTHVMYFTLFPFFVEPLYLFINPLISFFFSLSCLHSLKGIYIIIIISY